MAAIWGAEPGAAPAPDPHPDRRTVTDPLAVPPEAPLALDPPAALEAAGTGSVWQMSVPAVGTAAWLVRERLTAWLTSARWPAVVVEDVVMAVSEAVSNSSEHAYPPGTPDPVIEISAVLETVADPVGGDAPQHTGQGRRLRIRIRDHGTWRPVPPEPGHRGRGLQMMMALMYEVLIHHGDSDGRPGTEVILISPTVVPEPPA